MPQSSVEERLTALEDKVDQLMEALGKSSEPSAETPKEVVEEGLTPEAADVLNEGAPAEDGTSKIASERRTEDPGARLRRLINRVRINF